MVTELCVPSFPLLALSFLLPLITRLAHSAEQGSPRVLILVPTRELGVQIEEQTKQLVKGQSSFEKMMMSLFYARVHCYTLQVSPPCVLHYWWVVCPLQTNSTA